MVERRRPRLRRGLLLLLVLTAFSLMGHYVSDAVIHLSAETCCVQGLREGRQSGETTHAADLHGRFLLSQVSVPGFGPARLALGDLATLLELTWTPPTPVRPPIAL